MKHRLVFISFLLAGLVAGCSESPLDPNSEKSEVEVNEISFSKSSLAENGLPKLTFSPAGKDKQNTRVRLVDTQFSEASGVSAASILWRMRKKPEILYQAWDDVISEHISEIQASVVFNANFGETFKNETGSVEIQYVNDKKEVIQKYSFDVYINEKGVAELQKPAIVKAEVKIYMKSGSSPELHGMIENDLGEMAAYALISFSGNENSKPLPIKRLRKGGFVVDIDGIETAKLNESTVPVSVTLLDANLQKTGESFDQVIAIVYADFTGRIRRVRVVESGNTSDYRITVNVVQDTYAEPVRVEFVQLQFNQTGTPKPIPQTAILTLKRENDERGTSQFVFSPLTFEGGAQPTGESYSVTATMMSADGKPIGFPVTQDVVVENNRNAVKFVSTSLFSVDGGKTWELQAKYEIQNNPIFIDVSAEVNPLFEGQARPVNPIVTMTQTGEEAGGIRVFSAPIEFTNGSPVGNTYAITLNAIYGFGTGTRRTTNNAGSKAELL